MAKLDLNGVLLIGGIALGGYALYRWFNASSGGIKDAADGLGGGIGTAGEGLGGGIGSIGDWLKSIFDASASGFNKLADGGTVNNFFTNQPPQYTNAGVVSVDNPITKIESTGAAYNMRIDTIRTDKGTSNIIAAPNTYYKNLGVGFNSKSQGYSSQYAGNKLPLPSYQKSVFSL